MALVPSSPSFTSSILEEGTCIALFECVSDTNAPSARSPAYFFAFLQHHWLRFPALHSSHTPVRPLLVLCPQAFAEAFEAFDITLEEFLSDTMTLKNVVLYHVLDSEVGIEWRQGERAGRDGVGKVRAAQGIMLGFLFTRA